MDSSGGDDRSRRSTSNGGYPAASCAGRASKAEVCECLDVVLACNLPCSLGFCTCSHLHSRRCFPPGHLSCGLLRFSLLLLPLLFGRPLVLPVLLPEVSFNALTVVVGRQDRAHLDGVGRDFPPVSVAHHCPNGLQQILCAIWVLSGKVECPRYVGQAVVNDRIPPYWCRCLLVFTVCVGWDNHVIRELFWCRGTIAAALFGHLLGRIR